MIGNKYDFVVLFSVKNANPNGDPLNGNRPRINHEGIGEVSDVCIKRKIRNRMMQMGEKVLIQSDDAKLDEYKSIKDRIDNTLDKSTLKDKNKFSEEANKSWIDVRSFGQVFAFKGDDMSVGVRGPVSIHSAFSIHPINITSIQITKSVNSTGDGSKKSSDTMGMKHRVDFGIYKFAGSINPQLASKTGFSDDDVEVIKQCLIELFENDSSSARPDGSMEVVKVYWWKHNNPNGQYSSAKVHNSLKIYNVEDVIEPKDINDYKFELEELEGLKYSIFKGK